jgi:hypothetical protein
MTNREVLALSLKIDIRNKGYIKELRTKLTYAYNALRCSLLLNAEERLAFTASIKTTLDKTADFWKGTRIEDHERERYGLKQKSNKMTKP